MLWSWVYVPSYHQRVQKKLFSRFTDRDKHITCTGNLLLDRGNACEGMCVYITSHEGMCVLQGMCVVHHEGMCVLQGMCVVPYIKRECVCYIPVPSHTGPLYVSTSTGMVGKV